MSFEAMARISEPVTPFRVTTLTSWAERKRLGWRSRCMSGNDFGAKAELETVRRDGIYMQETWDGALIEPQAG
jgi:hypothetical protein